MPQLSSHTDPPRAARHLRLVVGLAAWLFVLAWLVGLAWSDRFLLTQFCSWIPTIMLVPVALAAAWVAGTRWSTLSWCIVALGLIGWWCFVEQPWRPGSGSNDGLSVLQWTMSHDKSDRVKHANYIVRENADITILTHGYGVRGTDEIRDWLGPGVHPYKLGFFTVLTRLPVRQLRPIAASRDIHARVIEIDTTEQLGRPLHIVAVDLPSTLSRSRWDVARTLRTWLEERGAGPIDLALGDFNMRRGSVALASIFPELDHAWDRAGHGWGPSWSRSLPLYRIDHVLVADWLDVLDCTTADPGIGRHRTQRVVLSGPRAAGGVEE